MAFDQSDTEWNSAEGKWQRQKYTVANNNIVTLIKVIKRLDRVKKLKRKLYKNKTNCMGWEKESHTGTTLKKHKFESVTVYNYLEVTVGRT